jgi:hypothetical protein
MRPVNRLPCSACPPGLTSPSEALASGLVIEKLAHWEPLYALGGRSLPPENLARHYDRTIAVGRRGDVIEFFIRRSWGSHPRSSPTRAQQSWRDQETLAHTFVYDTILLADGSLPAERAAAVTAPTLVIEVGASFPLMRGTARALADVVSNARPRTLDDQEHNVDPAVLAPVLMTFLVT